MKAIEQSQARQLYAQGISRKEIATKLGVSRVAVNDWTGNMPLPKKTCHGCQKQFQPKRTNTLYCTQACRILHVNKARKPTPTTVKQCEKCQKDFHARNGTRHKYCSRKCRTQAWNDNYRKQNAESANKE